eukprot:6441568-Alexandrium_andersonii.AAC.1
MPSARGRIRQPHTAMARARAIGCRIWCTRESAHAHADAQIIIPTVDLYACGVHALAKMCHGVCTNKHTLADGLAQAQ